MRVFMFRGERTCGRPLINELFVLTSKEFKLTEFG